MRRWRNFRASRQVGRYLAKQGRLPNGDSGSTGPLLEGPGSLTYRVIDPLLLTMRSGWDPPKSERNTQEPGLPFEIAMALLTGR